MERRVIRNLSGVNTSVINVNATAGTTLPPVEVVDNTSVINVNATAGTTLSPVEVVDNILYLDKYIGIKDIEQTTTSTENGGVNIITVTLTDDTTKTFQVRNGQGLANQASMVKIATVANLDKIASSSAAGDFAYVQQTKDTYFYTGSEWVKIMDGEDPQSDYISNDDIDEMFL